MPCGIVLPCGLRFAVQNAEIYALSCIGFVRPFRLPPPVWLSTAQVRLTPYDARITPVHRSPDGAQRNPGVPNQRCRREHDRPRAFSESTRL
jgi:hypothetical protein